MFYSLYHFKFVPFAIVRSICCIISSSPLFAVSFQVLCTHCIQSMSSRCFVHCCDPLKSHTRKRILGGGSHSLRPIPNSLIIKFPSLHLTRKHKICCVCRQKWYTLAPEDLSTIAGVSDGPEKEADIPECSGYASKTMASMDICSQNDEDDQTDASHSVF